MNKLVRPYQNNGICMKHMFRGILMLMLGSQFIWPIVSDARHNSGYQNRIDDGVVTKSGQRRSSHPTYGGTLIWGTINAPTIINPILTQTSISASLMGLLFDPLIRVDFEGNVIPCVAESWDVSDDQLTYTFYLRDDVYFHDGQKLDAEDVEYTYRILNDPENNSPWRTSSKIIKSWTVIDEYTIVLRLNEYSDRILYKMGRPIIPKHLFENQDLVDMPQNYHPIGTGSFKFSEWDRDTNQIELVVNEEYFNGRPYLNKIIIKTYLDNASLWAALMRHEVDLVKYLTPADYQVVKTDEDFNGHEILWRMYLALVYDLKDEILGDLNVRKAISYAVNREGMLKTIHLGGWSEGASNEPANPVEVQNSQGAYNPEYSIELLDELQWIDSNNDGIRDKNGQDLVIKLLVDKSNVTYIKIAQLLRQQLAEVGIKISLLLYESEKEFTDEYLEKNKPQAWLRFIDGTAEDHYIRGTFSNWYSLSNVLGKLWDFKSDQIDDLFEAAMASKEDQLKNKYFRQIHEIVSENHLACFLFIPFSYHAVSSDFHNTENLFTSEMPIYTIKDWYVNSNKMKGGEV